MEIRNIFIDTKDYEITSKRIGKGSFGTVYIIKKISNKQKYAAKILKYVQDFNGDEQMRFLREFLILSKLHYPSIVKLIGITFQSFKDSSKFSPAIITEYIERGSLKKMLDLEKRALADFNWSPTKKYMVLLGIAHAMKYLHNNLIIHRDLKPENILLDDELNPHICDFGLSKYFEPFKSKTMTSQIGTPLYMAPELIQDYGKYDQSVDVFAFSIIVYEVISGRNPYFELGEVSTFQLLNKIKNGYRPKYSESITTKMWKLLNKCWSDRPNDRPSFDCIFNELSIFYNEYSFEQIDEYEIKDYLEDLNEEVQEPKNVKNSDNQRDYITKLEQENKELKEKIKKIEEEKNSISLSENELYSGLSQIIVPLKSRNYKEAIQQLENSSKQDNCCASFILGLLYESGEVIEKDYEKSFNFYSKSTSNKNPNSLYKTGYCYANGQGVIKDYKKAIDFFQKAAELDSSDALVDLGIFYSNGIGVEKDYLKAMECFEKAAELGNSNALNLLGYFYEEGQIVEQNFSKAIQFYSKAAEKNNSDAMNNLGLIYANGKGVKQDYDKAIYFYEKAANHGSHFAMNNLGFLYANGKGVKQDYAKAIDYYTKAASFGDNISFYSCV